MNRYGFIGLGSQGAPMAQRMIDAGLPVVLWARRPQSLESFAGSGAGFAANVAELGRQADYVAVCVVDDGGVREICDRLIPTMQPGGRIVIHSTVHPELCQSLAAEAAGRGLKLIDAPVSGGGGAAAAGTLTVMVGGDPVDVEAIRPVLASFAGKIVHLGPVGAGQNAKLVNNTLMAANLATAWHALRAAGSLGIQRDAFVELVNISSGRSFAFEVCSRIDRPASFSHGAALLAKDVGLLGEALDGDAAFAPLRDTAAPFLALALEK